MKAEIISIGTELLLGSIVDTNSSFIAGQLPALGIDLYWISQVGDNQGRLLEILQRAWERSDLIITTGGLGPTEDDITRDAIACLMGEPTVVDALSLQQIRERFERFGRKMTDNNVRQAEIIPSARMILNDRGTAPGWWVEKNGKYLVAMPGPPGEMKRMWLREVLPCIRSKIGSQKVIFSRTIKLWGLSESYISETMAPFFTSTNPTLGIYVKRDGIHLRLTAKSNDINEAREIIAPSEEKIKAIFQNELWGYDDDTMEGNVINILNEQAMTIAVLENYTGGLLSYTVAEPCRERFSGSLVFNTKNIVENSITDTEKSKTIMNTPYPAKAGLLARAVKDNFSADVAVSLTSVSDDTAQVDYVYLGIVKREKENIVSLKYSRDRVNAKQMAASAALFYLIKVLTNEADFAKG